MLQSLIARALSDPAVLSELGPVDWDRIVREARATQLLGRLAWLAREVDPECAPLSSILDFVLAHEDLVDAQHDAVRYEVCEILDALDGLNAPVVFLKGSAHILASSAASRGRTLGDIDIMVPSSALHDTELRLKLAGWSNSHYSAYDQRYYRQWMHELPAMQHRIRRSVVDVHHTILPPTAKASLDARKLFEKATVLEGFTNACVLSEDDTLIHCATHLFHEGEFEKGLRDLHDFALLFETRIKRDDGCEALIDRALELDLAWPLYLASRYMAQVFGQPSAIPAMKRLEAILRPSAVRLRFLDGLFLRAFLPHHPFYDGTGTHLARGMLYIRSHWLRMPPHLLARHLTRKAMTRISQKDDERGH